MGWRDVGRYPVAVRLASASSARTVMQAKVPAERWSQPLSIGIPFTPWLEVNAPLTPWRVDEPDVRAIRTNVAVGFLRWRFGTELLGYRLIDDPDAAVVVRTRRRGPATELVVAALVRGDWASAVDSRHVGSRTAAATTPFAPARRTCATASCRSRPQGPSSRGAPSATRACHRSAIGG